MGHFSAAAGGQKPAASGKKNWGGIILDYIVGIFQPLVPAIAGAGILKALLTLCTTFGLLRMLPSSRTAVWILYLSVTI